MIVKRNGAGWVCSVCGYESTVLTDDELRVGHTIPTETIFEVRGTKYKKRIPKFCGVWAEFDEKLG